MKMLSDILYKVKIDEVIGSTHIEVKSIQFDSRKINASCVFVAIKGEVYDGHKFINETIEKGAVAIVCEEFPKLINKSVTYIKVKNASEALAYMACNLYDNPSEKIKLIGITGTNGKTTSVTLLYNLFKNLGYKVGLISTVKNCINTEEVIATHTTPDSLMLNQLLQKMIDKGCTYCFMEVSSHAIIQHRITGINFKIAAFTNITHDHLDYHKTFENYILAKKEFFDTLNSKSIALVNKDDRNGMVMLQNTKAIKKTFSQHSVSDYKFKIIENHFNGLLLNIDGTELWTKLIGSFNAYNLLLVYAVAILLNENKETVLTELSNLSSVEGRFQFIKNNQNIIGIVDYAHTPDALKNVLKTIRDIRTGNEKVITVVGCGGDRDALKRPIMAEIACSMSNNVILTSDNPRSEDPQVIIDEMKKGVDPTNARKILSILDRREAIKTACSIANKNDIILIAGKGHEKYQDINGIKFPFDDMKELQEILLIN